jgi:uncharacterized protein
MAPVEQRDGYVLLRVRVQPKASRNALCVDETGRIRVALTAPPVDDAANKALVAYIAKRFALSRRTVHLDSGAKSREKTLRLDMAKAEEILSQLPARETG